MKAGYHIGKNAAGRREEIDRLLISLQEVGADVYPVADAHDLLPETDLLLSLGGDGTFLTTSRIAAPSGVPVLGVNFGRLGFLSECQPENVASALREGRFSVEERDMLVVDILNGEQRETHYALNEVSVLRLGSGTLGIDAEVDGCQLPTYWADGLLVATSSGSTAYSLSVGGPICMPDAHVHILAPVAPHNINVRPLVLSSNSCVTLRLHSCSKSAVVEMDNRRVEIDSKAVVRISDAPFKLKLLTLGKAGFIGALRGKLFWGEDRRNSE